MSFSRLSCRTTAFGSILNVITSWSRQRWSPKASLRHPMGRLTTRVCEISALSSRKCLLTSKDSTASCWQVTKSSTTTSTQISYTRCHSIWWRIVRSLSRLSTCWTSRIARIFLNFCSEALRDRSTMVSSRLMTKARLLWLSNLKKSCQPQSTCRY